MQDLRPVNQNRFPVPWLRGRRLVVFWLIVGSMMATAAVWSYVDFGRANWAFTLASALLFGAAIVTFVHSKTRSSDRRE